MTTESTDEITEKAEERPQPGTLDTDSVSKELDSERSHSNALEAKLSEVAKDMKAKLPEALQKLIPEGLSVSEQIDWINNAAASDLARPRQVPRTDTRPPAIQQKKLDPSELPPVARIASSYATAQ